jgi:N-acetylmuramoyl-L-alanine amidase
MATYKEGDRGAVVKQIQKITGCYPDGIWGKVTTECVKAWQLDHHLQADGIVGNKTLAAMGIIAVANAVSTAKKDVYVRNDGSILKKSKRRIDYIVVHCTATPEGREMTVEQIRAEHKKQGWSDIGYHYVVTLDGKVHAGRDVDIAGSHVAGYNANSIGVVYVGGLENNPKKTYAQLKAKDTRTDAQKASLLSLLMDLRKLYTYAKIQGHRDFPGVKKDCPSFDAKQAYRNV